MTGQSRRLQQVPYERRKLKLQKKDYFSRILSYPLLYEINTSNFQKMFLDRFRNFSLKEFKKNKSIYFYNKKQTDFFNLTFVLVCKIFVRLHWVISDCIDSYWVINLQFFAVFVRLFK